MTTATDALLDDWADRGDQLTVLLDLARATLTQHSHCSFAALVCIYLSPDDWPLPQQRTG